VRKLKVLMVDDSSAMQKIVERALRHTGSTSPKSSKPAMGPKPSPKPKKSSAPRIALAQPARYPID
jgi:hypothetical protein